MMMMTMIIATSGFLTALECTKFVLGRGSAPGSRWGSLQRSPRLPSWFNADLLLRGRVRKGERRERGEGIETGGKGEGKARRREEKGREGDAP